MESFHFVSFILSLIATVVLSEICLENQICVPIDHCSSVNEKLYQKNLNGSDVIDLKRLQCGFIENKVYVCCNSSLPRPGKCGGIAIVDKLFVAGGKRAGLGEYPWTVLIGRRWKEANNKTGISYECGGSLINDRYILTAAHCVKFLSYANYKERIKTIEIVRLSEWNIETDPDEDVDGFEGEPVVEAVVEKIIPHKNYRLYKKYDDIALLRLKGKVNFTQFIKPICLPEEGQELIGNLIAIGWGKTNASDKDLESIQRYVDLQLVNNEQCDEIYENYKIASTQLCTGSAGKDSCSGDSGGPLVGIRRTANRTHWYLAGIVSFGRVVCGSGAPGIYTDVRKYIDWIQQNIIH